jgi:hypothetical protein
MKRLGLVDPYLPLREPPPDHARMRRHQHPRFRFEPRSENASGEAE